MGRAAVNSVLVASGLFLLAGNVEAQRSGGPSGFLSVSFVAADPVGELGYLVDEAFGLELGAGAPVSDNGLLRIRGDLGFVIYGLEHIQYCSYGCRVGSDLTTTNSIVYGGVGPELVLGHGAIQPYARASAGLSYFVTSSSLDDNDGYGPYLETTNYSDLVFGWKFGGGLRFRVGGGHRPVYIDLGVERHDNGVANYLTEGDIEDHADGSVTIHPNRSEADLMSYRFGVTLGLF